MAADKDAAVEGETPQEDVRAKFREALERKNAKHTEAAEGAEGLEQSKVHSAHGPASTQRSFRRKSG